MRGDRKLPDCRAIPSLQDILVVSSTEPRIEHFRREPDGWKIHDLRGQDALRLEAFDVTIELLRQSSYPPRDADWRAGRVVKGTSSLRSSARSRGGGESVRRDGSRGIINGTRAVTADTALRLGIHPGIPPEFCPSLQSRYDLKRICCDIGDSHYWVGVLHATPHNRRKIRRRGLTTKRFK